MANQIVVEIVDLPALAEFAQRFAALLPRGTVVALNGTLGAGKTRFVQAVAAAVGIDPAEVMSPTFVLCREYRANQFTIYPADTYRLRNEDEFLQLGPEEWFEADGWVFLEWAERVANCLPESYVALEIEVTGETSRRLTLRAIGEKYQPLLAALRE